MTQARREIINLDFTPYYHCIARCVRRAFLCGEDFYTGQSFEHRRQWLVDLIKELSEVFCIDICAYAILSNHYHLVLHVDRKKALNLSDDEVVERWLHYFKGPVLAQRYHAGGPLTDKHLEELKALIQIWRHELYNISRFMKELNQKISKMANQEDNCSGRFWEARFKSQALLDESALLTCMAYVDLNPIRAGICDTLEESDFTSIQERLLEYSNKPNQRKTQIQRTKRDSDTRHGLMPFLRRENCTQKPEIPLPETLPLVETDYIQWVDYIGRITRKGKRGAIPQKLQPIFNKLDMQVNTFLETMNHLETLFPVRMGQYATLVNYAEQAGLCWSHGFSYSRKMNQVA